MNKELLVLSDEQMKSMYGSFFYQGARIKLNKENVPNKLWPLLHYAGFWGVSDDWTREKLVQNAPQDALLNLKAVISAWDNDLDEWLAGFEADNPAPSTEYVAFSAMRMAADFI